MVGERPWWSQFSGAPNGFLTAARAPWGADDAASCPRTAQGTLGRGRVWEAHTHADARVEKGALPV